MTGQGEMSIRAVARRVDRNVSGVVFAHDAVHVDFMLTKATSPQQAA